MSIDIKARGSGDAKTEADQQTLVSTSSLVRPALGTSHLQCCPHVRQTRPQTYVRGDETESTAAVAAHRRSASSAGARVSSSARPSPSVICDVTVQKPAKNCTTKWLTRRRAWRAGPRRRRPCGQE